MSATLFDPADVDDIEGAFYDFIQHVKIDSKESGTITLADPYMAQRRFLTGVFDGLKDDVHWFVVLKARQLGITTMSLVLDLFWISYFPGLQGGIVFDTDGNKEKARILFTRMLESLPRSHSIPVVRHNTQGLVLKNGSSLDYLVAGTRKNGGLGRSRAYNFLHATECSSWGDQEGLESLTKSLAAKYPARLYVFESTARGYNLFHTMWEEAKEDTLVKRAIFIGWWAKEDYAFNPKASFKERELFERYSKAPITEEEQELIDYVKKEYDFEVSLSQLAWYRHEKDPAGEGDVLTEDSSSILEQEMPWHEEQAFMLTGVNFFQPILLNEAVKEAVKLPFKAFRYHMGEDFLATALEQLKNPKLAQLKVWEDPDPGATYVVGADPAYGSGDSADRYCAQVFRVYADGMDQVAEFCTPNLKTYQFTWVVAHLCGLYSNARLLLELNGPGEAVFTEFRNLQTMLQSGLLAQRNDKGEESEESKSAKNILRHVRTYLYHRADSFGSGAAPHWKTTYGNKIVLYNQFRDAFSLGQIKIRSVPCLEEMRNIVQEGGSIQGEGNSKDDRPMAVALATRAWIDSERKRMQTQGLTREAELNSKQLTHVDMNKIFTSNLIADFFARQQAQRAYDARKARAGGRWNW